VHWDLPTVRADGVDDAGTVFGACSLCNEGIVPAYSDLWEGGRRKRREREKGQRKGRVEEEPTLSFWWKMLVRALADAQWDEAIVTAEREWERRTQLRDGMRITSTRISREER
jgi:hypothetical protein